MGASRIEQLIEDIYEFVESCKMYPLSSTKVIVPKDELYDLVDELRLRTPDEIKRYQKIIANKDAILQDARDKADAMLAQAQEQTNALINEHESTKAKYDGLLTSLKGNLDIVVNNKRELTVSMPQQQSNFAEEEIAQSVENQDDFDFDENTFLDDIE